MQIHTAKHEAMQAIEQLPDTVEFSDIVYRLHVLDTIQKGLKEINDGEPGLTVDELRREIEQW
ncbi:MAG TPA: hypothetical protein PK031_06215 [Pseudomonadales bacterium]|nr:hypothetical protein [Pseudomonadales bacterium]